MGRMLRQWRRGRHSNLPRCCVGWYVLVRIHLPKRFIHWKAKRYLHARPYRIPDAFSYVRCPLCHIRGRWAVQHICGIECLGHRDSVDDTIVSRIVNERGTW